jgi:hypothetical protein
MRESGGESRRAYYNVVTNARQLGQQEATT